MVARDALAGHDDVAPYLIGSVLLAGLVFDKGALGYGRSRNGAHRPEAYQFVPADMFNSPWLAEIPELFNDGGDEERYLRRRMLIADEGGMGKTFAAALCARDEVLRGGSVLVIAPKGLKRQWRQEFARIGVPLVDTTVAKI